METKWIKIARGVALPTLPDKLSLLKLRTLYSWFTGFVQFSNFTSFWVLFESLYFLADCFIFIAVAAEIISSFFNLFGAKLSNPLFIISSFFYVAFLFH